MWLLRTFQTQSWFNAWHERKPPIENLLKCFDREKSHTDPVSTFRAYTAADELECAAAHFQTFNRTDFAVHCIVRFDSDECRRAGIITEPAANEGLTGVLFVDAKHFLEGNHGPICRINQENRRKNLARRRTLKTISGSPTSVPDCHFLSDARTPDRKSCETTL